MGYAWWSWYRIANSAFALTTQNKASIFLRNDYAASPVGTRCSDSDQRIKMFKINCLLAVRPVVQWLAWWNMTCTIIAGSRDRGWAVPLYFSVDHKLIGSLLFSYGQYYRKRGFWKTYGCGANYHPVFRKQLAILPAYCYSKQNRRLDPFSNSINKD